MNRNQRREAIVRVLLTDAEKHELLKAANKASLPLAIYVRTAALEKARAR